METKLLLPNLSFAGFQHLTLGPVEFFATALGVEVSTEIDLPQDLRPNLISDALYLLYFCCNGYKIYNGVIPDPICAYFQKKEMGAKVVITQETIDTSIFPAFSELLFWAYTMGAAKKDDSRKFIQSISFLLNRYLNDREGWECPNWNHYLELSLGFEALFNLNPSNPGADLRQKLRPLLHLKFSSPVELLWKWVDLFFSAKGLLLKGQTPSNLCFSANPDIKSPLYLIAEKLLIFSIYDLLFQWHLSLGIAGTKTTPDSFSKIPPERVLVYFWTLETIDKKLTLLSITQNDKELEMLLAIKTMHEKLQS
jgi:hypothetical protein